MVDVPSGPEGKKSACNAGDPGSVSGLGRSPGEGNGYPAALLPGESHGHRNMAGYGPWGHKESDTTERVLRVPLKWVDFQSCIIIFLLSSFQTLHNPIISKNVFLFL